MGINLTLEDQAPKPLAEECRQAIQTFLESGRESAFIDDPDLAPDRLFHNLRRAAYLGKHPVRVSFRKGEVRLIRKESSSGG